MQSSEGLRAGPPVASLVSIEALKGKPKVFLLCSRLCSLIDRAGKIHRVEMVEHPKNMPTPTNAKQNTTTH